MKLTNTIREAFIRAAMNDVPCIDYHEQIRSAAVAAAVKDLPLKVAALWKDTTLRHWVKTNSATVGGWSVNVPSVLDGWDDRKAENAKLEAACAQLVAKQATQQRVRDELKQKLKAAAYSYSTRKALADALPEFAKYLPADNTQALRSVPAIANVVSDFMKAGWPKGKKATATA